MRLHHTHTHTHTVWWMALSREEEEEATYPKDEGVNDEQCFQAGDDGFSLHGGGARGADPTEARAGGVRGERLCELSVQLSAVVQRRSVTGDVTALLERPLYPVHGTMQR